MLHRRLFTDSKNAVSLGLGAVFLRPFGYTKEVFYKDGSKNNPDDVARIEYKIGITARMAVSYSKRLFNTKFRIFTEIYGDYKFNTDYYESRPSAFASDLTDDRFDIGINLGFEFLFAQSPLSYYSGR